MKRIDFFHRVIQKLKQVMKCLWRKMCRTICAAAAHRDTIGYYAVLTLVLVALGAAANDYRSRLSERKLSELITVEDPGISVQTRPDPTLAPEIRKDEYIMPVNGPIVREFSDSDLIWSTTLQLWQTHPAVDISAQQGEAVVSAANGKVAEVYSDPLYGNVIVILNEDGTTLRYSSLGTLQLVKAGQTVAQGDVISSVGTCNAEAELGLHVHIEYFKDQKPADFSLLIDRE